MKKSLFAAAALAGALTLTAIPVMADEPDYASMKIVLILPGSIDDQSWNASNNAGAKALTKPLELPLR